MKIKPFYIYGTFLVVFIASCFLWMIKNNIFREEATYIQYRDKDIEKILGYNLEEYIKTKSIVSFELNGNEKYDDSILKIFQLEIQKIMKAEDSKKGIHLKFGKKNSLRKCNSFISNLQIGKMFDLCSRWL
ncbi:hypothetical protein [Flavobacterium tyrosinilyticum]|uniref:hypothetical protein n=1 Tax=Flavobacterium tyrosinilyticum TaxID=1658740 RepID=UPI0020303A38|nr:hypothetical protein [Flavobacterium tyrosinilyticum]MCM0666208.1 hypothetical protein [Flavobacterium tyrosinilyticum]